MRRKLLSEVGKFSTQYNQEISAKLLTEMFNKIVEQDAHHFIL